MGIYVPTLTDRKFDNDINHMLLKIYQYYVTSDYGQTLTYYTHVKSLRASLKHADYEPDKAKDIIEQDLTEMMQHYFGNKGNVDVNIETKKTLTDKNKIIYKIYINLSVVDNGKTYSLNNRIDSTNLKDLTFNDYLDYLLQGGPDE